MGKGGDDFVATLTQFVVGLEYVGVLVVVDPFVGTHRDVGVGSVFVAVFDDVDVLDAEAVAAAEDGAGVVGLEDVFEHYADVACAVLDETVEELALVVAVEFCGGVVEALFFFKGVFGKEVFVAVFDFGHGFFLIEN